MILDHQSRDLNWLNPDGDPREGNAQFRILYMYEAKDPKKEPGGQELHSALSELTRLTRPGDWGILYIWQNSRDKVEKHKLSPSVMVWYARHLLPTEDGGNHGKPYHLHQVNGVERVNIPQPLYYPKSDSSWIYSNEATLEQEILKYWAWDENR